MNTTKSTLKRSLNKKSTKTLPAIEDMSQKRVKREKNYIENSNFSISIQKQTVLYLLTGISATMCILLSFFLVCQYVQNKPNRQAQPIVQVPVQQPVPVQTAVILPKISPNTNSSSTSIEMPTDFYGNNFEEALAKQLPNIQEVAVQQPAPREEITPALNSMPEAHPVQHTISIPLIESPTVVAKNEPQVHPEALNARQNLNIGQRARNAVNEASTAIRKWLQQQHVQAVANKGLESCMIMNGKSFRLGDIVNPDYDVIWTDIDRHEKRLYFSDSKGFTYSTNY